MQALGVERVEQYLALLTTDGPLVPIDTCARHAGRRGAGGPKSGSRTMMRGWAQDARRDRVGVRWP